MKSISKSKISLALALGICLCAPQSTWAATAAENSGGVLVERTDNQGVKFYDYIGSSDNVNPTNTGGKVIIYTESMGGKTVSSVYGGYSTDSNAASNNTVTVNSGTISGDNIGNGFLYGGYSKNGDASNNTVNINGGNIKTRIHGGKSDAIGGAAVVGNTVNINHTNIIAHIYGGYSADNEVIENTVNITGSSVEGLIYGGWTSGTRTAANYNKVVMRDATGVTGVTGVAGVAGGISIRGDAIGNVVELINCSGIEQVIGGMSENGTASNNTVVIKDGNLSNDAQIYAGYGDMPTATDNTITIEGRPMLGNNIVLYGGFAVSSTSVDIRTGNRLNIYTSGISVKTMDNFQHYDLAIDKGKTTLKVDDALTLQTGDTIQSTRVLSDMDVGDKVTLLESTNGLDIDNAQLINGKAKQGILFDYGYELSMVNGELVANIISKEGNTQSMSVADGQLAAMGMLRSGADLVASAAMDNAAKANSAYDVFGALNYNNISMNSVSNIDVQGSSMLVGMGRNIQHTHRNLTIGAFLESGWGTYESSLGVARAKGHTNYYGMGILARSNNNSGLYTEGSIRVGKIGNTYSGNTIDDGTYDVSSTYYGLHLGIGKINQINDKTSTDIYLKYFYAHEGGTDTNIAGDKFNFDSINSHRIRVGGRLNSTNKNIKRYVGLAYEYEFSGKATATAYGVDIATPTAKGSSGLLELGLVYKPATDSKFSMDMGVNGYLGKRKGVTGNVTLNWGF